MLKKIRNLNDKFRTCKRKIWNTRVCKISYKAIWIRIRN